MSLPSINLNPVTVSVSVSKQKVNPVNLILTQEYGEHHHFEIVLDYDMYGDDFMNNPLKHIELIGRLVYIRFNNKVSLYGEYLFKGVVTSVRQTGKEGKKGYLVINGSSPTIMLEKGNRMDIYSNRSLYQITSKIAERAYTDYIKFGSEPVFKNKIDFLMQYNESDWDFLKRLAYLYRENFFYSGHELLFGYYPDLKTVDLTYDREIIDLEFRSRMTSNNVKRYQYVPETDAIIERESPEKIDNSNDYLDKAEEMSHYAMTLQDKSNSYMETPLYSNSEITEMLKRDKARNAAESITIKGRSKTYKTSIGQVINISMPDILSETSNIGTYRVIKSVHSIDESGRYSCEFEAVPATIEVMPVAEPKLLTADSIVAVVKSNEDPLNQGRVQVSFDFSSAGSYAWLRVLTPNAGSSEAVSQNRGMVFIPEKGDQVMVGFEYGDPNRPYVMGSLFHGKNGKGGGKNNNIKSITTSSGITIEFDDNQKSLLLKDASGSQFFMDGQGNIDINASKRFRVTSGQLELNSHNDVVISAKNNFLISVGNLINQTATSLKYKINNYIHLFSETSLISSKENMQLQARNVNALGTDMLKLHSDSSLVANSMGVMDLKSIDNMSLTQDAQQTPRENEENIALAIVEFRPEFLYSAKYGFDWVRMGDIPFDKKAADNITHAIDNKESKRKGKPVYITEPGITALETELEAELEKARKATSEAARNAAYQKAYEIKTQLSALSSPLAYNKLLEQEYTDTITVIKKATGSNIGIDKYYVPFLHLYTKKVSDSISEGEKPPYEAVFKAYVSIDSKLDALEFDYNKEYFTIDKDTLPDKEPCARKQSTEIRISCIADSDGFDSDQEILVWAYPEGSKALPTKAEQDAQRKLAGKLIVGKNTRTYRNSQKVLLVQVKMDLNDRGESLKIDFNEDENKYLRRFMYQALTFCEIETSVEKPILDLTGDDDFKIKTDTSKSPAVSKYGKYIFENGKDSSPAYKRANGPHAPAQEGRDGGIFTDETGFHETLRNRYLNTKELKDKYGKHVLVFLFPNKSYQDVTNPWVPVIFSEQQTLLGQANELGGAKKSLVIFPARTAETMGHEVLHTLGLHHPFSNEKHVNNKYRYKYEQTDNVMDYGNNPKHALWRWQWRIINPNLNKK